MNLRSELGRRKPTTSSQSKYVEELDAAKLRAGLATALHISQPGNLFFQTNKLDGKLHEN
ncbi:hypothetical protein ACJ72_03165 [Emergomyces africanus]|uniref:Uncharacterized protein n=1 Tax=Emergomyces africanus TaxID=1955775 RepID=A0A1B7P0C0_9EURO|nr:hypothetical protein ACJ72_03165 [Emergomyces africanus]